MIRRLHPSGFGFVGGFLFGLLIVLFGVGDLVSFLARTPPAEAQFGPGVRIMDRAHTQLAVVDHTGALSVSLGPTVAISHLSSVTHISGRVILQNVAGTAVTVSGTALDMNLSSIGGTAQSGANVIDTTNLSFRVSQTSPWNVGHVTSVTHVQVSGSGTPTQSLSVRCVNTGGTAFADCGGSGGGDTVNVFHQSTIRHISSVTHIAGAASIVDRAGNYVTVTAGELNVACSGCAAASVVAVTHISGAVHVVNSFGRALHIQGLGVPGASHGGVLTVQGITGMNPMSVSQSTARWNVDHITSVTHMLGRVYLTNVAGTAVTVTGTALDVNCTGCAAATVVEVDHISSVVHIVGYAGAALHIQGLGTPGQSHGGVLSIQGVNNGNAVAVNQSLAAWNIAHISAQLHVANTTVLNALAVRCVSTGGTAFEACGGSGSGDAVNVFHQSTIRHISSVTHIVGYAGAALHMQGIGLPGTAHGGVVSIQGVGGMVAVSVSQSITAWTVAHVTSVSHVVGRVYLTNQAGVAVTVTGTALDVSCTGCSSAATVHISAALHVAGTIPGAAFHIQGVGLPGASHGGILTIQGITGMNAVAVSQSGGWAVNQSGSWTVQAAHQGGEWNVSHVSAVVHVSIVGSRHLTGAIHVVGLSNIGSGAPGTYTTQMVCHSTLAVHVAAAAPGYTQLIHLTSTNNNVDQTSWRIYICGIVLVSAHAQAFSLLEGTGTTCATGKRPLMGSWRPDDAFVMAASGGIASVAPFPWISTQNPGNNLCIVQTSRTTGSISGVITYRAGP